jgi:hypothetical protein
VGPFSKVPEIEVQIVRLGQRIEVGKVEIEDISRLERPEGCHIEKSDPLVTVMVGMNFGNVMPKECLGSNLSACSM